MKVKIKKLNDLAVIPSYAKQGDAGMDITAISKQVSEDGLYIEYKTGLAIEIPEGYVGLIFPRSSVSKTTLSLANAVGVIDSGYRGEISFRFKDSGISVSMDNNDFVEGIAYNVGDRVGQLIILPFPTIEFEEVTELSNTTRGKGSYGSTGK